MKLPSIALLAAVCLAVPLAASAQVSPFRLRVEQVTKSDTEKFSKKQQRSLKIFVSNSSKDPGELIAKYVFFGRELKGSEIVKLDEGEKAISVGPLSTTMVESGVATATSEEAHSSGYSSGGGRSKGGSSGKKVEASGQKFTGYGVQLFLGDKMVAEQYDPPSGKEQWSKAYPAKLPTAAPAKKK